MQSSNRLPVGLFRGLFRARPLAIGSETGRFHPDATEPLEGRALMSASVLDGRASTAPGGHGSVSVQFMGETIARRSSLVSMEAHLIEEPNLPYPIPAGPSENLNVYLPQGPVPPGGRPVLVAIHGGGWRRLDKAGYGDRIASAFVPRGYVVVAPNYMLSAPGRPSWPVNLEDVRSVVAGCAPMRTRWDQPERGRGDRRVGRRQPGRVARDRSGPPDSGGISTASSGRHCFFDTDQSDVPGRGESPVPAWRRPSSWGDAAAGSRELRRGVADRSCCAGRSADVSGARVGGPADTGESVRGDGGRAERRRGAE